MGLLCCFQVITSKPATQSPDNLLLQVPGPWENPTRISRRGCEIISTDGPELETATNKFWLVSLLVQVTAYFDNDVHSKSAVHSLRRSAPPDVVFTSKSISGWETWIKGWVNVVLLWEKCSTKTWAAWNSCPIAASRGHPTWPRPRLQEGTHSWSRSAC